MTTSLAEPANQDDVHRSVQVDLSANTSAFSRPIQQATGDVNALTAALGQAGQQADSLSKMAGRKLFQFSVGDFAALSGGVAVAARFEHQLSTLNATAAVTGTSMSGLKREISDVFTNFPVWRQEIVALAQSISNLGVTKPSDISALTTSYTKLGGATGESSVGLATGGVQLAREMGTLDPDRIDKYNNSLLTLSKTAGVSATAVQDFAGNLAPFARQAGIGEAAVLGISAAFQKAGADGYYASTAFNQIIQDITRLQQSGSPDISKYSSFLGLTNQQFAGLSPTEQATQIFEQVAKGGPAAAAFTDQLGGTRVQTAITRVAQSGDLRNLVGLSQASATNTDNLNKGADAAFAGLTNSVSMVRNEFTELGTIIGDPLLRPFEALADGVSKIVGALNSGLKLLGPLPGIAAAGAGALALPAAFGLAHAGLAGTLALGRYAFGRSSGARTAMRHGQEVAGAIEGGMDPFEAAGLNETARRAATGELPRHAQLAFLAGQQRGAPGAGPISGLMGGLRDSAFYAAASSGYQRGRGGLGNLAARGGAYLVESQNDVLDEQNKSAFNRRGFQRAAGEDVTGGRGPIRRMVRGLAQFPFLSTAAIGETGAAAARTARGAIPEGAGALGVASRVGLTAASVSGRSVGLLARGGAAVAAAATNPGVLIGATIGLPIAAAITDAIKKSIEAPKQVTESLSGASRYDQVLDQTSSNLAKFGGAVDDAADRLSKFANTPVSQLTGVTAEDVGAVMGSNYKVSDQSLTDIANKSGGDQGAILAYLNAQGLQAGDVGGDRFTKYKQDLLSTMGVGRAGDVSNIMTQFAAGLTQPGGVATGASFDVLGRLAAGAGNDQYKNILGPAIAGVVAGTQNTGAQGSQVQLSDILRLGGESLVNDTGKQNNQASFAAYLQTTYGIDPKQFENQVVKAGRQVTGMPQGKPIYDSSGHLANTYFPDQGTAGQVLATAFANTSQGKDYLAQAGITVDDLLRGVQNPRPFPSATASDTDLKTLRTQGSALGTGIAGTGVVQTFQQTPGSVGTQQQALNTIVQQSLKGSAGAGTGDAEIQLRQLAGTVGGANTALGQLLTSAGDAASGLTSLQEATQTHAGGTMTAVTTANRMRGELTPDSTPEQVQASQQADQSALQSGAGLLQYARSLTDRVRQANKDNQRSQEDYNRQVAYANQAFYTQESRMAADYYRQEARAERDYETQSERSEEDYNRQRSRQLQQFNTQQARAEQDYDKQRERELQDFNTQQTRAEQDYDKQRSRQLQDFNTQQVRAEQDYNKQRERELVDFNTQQARAQADYDKQQSRQLEDFNTQQARAQTDYDKQRTRQISDFNLQQTRGLQDFHTEQLRSVQDFNKQLRRQAEETAQNIYDPFTRVQRKPTTTAGLLLRNLTNQNVDIQKQLRELNELVGLGITQETIQTLNLADPANAQEVDALYKSLKSSPALAAQINTQATTRVSATKALTQSNFSTTYQNEVEDFNTAQKRAQQDFDKSVSRSEEDMSKSLDRSAADFATSVSRSQADLSRSMRRSATDFTTSTNRSRQDLSKSLSRSATDYATSVTRSQQDLSTSLSRSADDFATSTERSTADLNTSLSRSADDFATSMQRSTDDFDLSLSQASEDFATMQSRAATDHATMLSDMAADFATASQRAADDHGVALKQMADQYKTAQDRAAQDLKDSFHEYTGGFNDIVQEMTSYATGQMEQYAPGAAKAFLDQISAISQVMSVLVAVPGAQVILGSDGSYQVVPPSGSGTTFTGGGGTFTVNGGSSGSGGGGGGGARPARAYAEGGISLNDQIARVSETGPELHLPLNTRGEDFMAGLIAKSLARGVTMAVSAAPDTTQSVRNDNSISFAGADIKVVAADPNKMARQLASQAKIKRLTSPV